jgi:hypothetical protein
MNPDIASLKSRLPQFLERRGVELNTRKKPPVLRCPSPNHEDNNPSAVLYDEHVFCPVCKETWDIFDVCGMLDGIDEFNKQLKTVQEMFGVVSEIKKPPPRTTTKSMPVLLSIDKARAIYNVDEFEKIGEKARWGKFIEAWPYKNEDGKVNIVDVRFENEKGKKTVISFWYNGNEIKSAGYPICLYNLDRVSVEDKPILIVEGAKSAKAAEVLTDFIPVTWNGGTNKVKYVDWKPLKDRKIYIYPDDDQKKDKRKKPYPWHKQPGISAAIEIKSKLPQAKIVRPLGAARNIKKDGADIVEALQVKKPEELSKYIIESKEVEPPKKKEAVEIKQDEFPFRVLGTSDDNRAYFIGLHGRLHDVPLSKITKGDLFVLSKIDWWRNIFGFGGKVDWEDALSTMAEIASRIDFDPISLRGRGAWREPDGSICYHDGKDTIGDKSGKRLYLRKTKRDIGLADEPAGEEIRRDISDTVCRMSFETPADSARLMAWAALGPFAGALPWRPCGMMTGSSGSGKTTVIDMFVRPLAIPETFSGGDSTEAGVRQRIKNDSAAIVIEEAETDTQKKRWRREDLFSLMRQSTSDDAPRVAKGTRDGKGMSFSMKSMFLFAAISPEVEHIADDNRIFRVNMVRPEGKWAPLRDTLKKLLTEKNCRSIRALIWQKLPDIIAFAERMTPLVQDITGKSSRYSLAESILFATYFIIWRGLENMSDKEICDRMWEFYEHQPWDKSYDETAEITDRILDERVMIEYPKREQISLREVLIACHTDKLPGMGIDEYLPIKEIQHLKNVAMRHGVCVMNGGDIAIANNHHEIMKIIGRGRGYQRVFYRHKRLIEKNKLVNFLGQTKRSVVIGGLLNSESEE